MPSIGREQAFEKFLLHGTNSSHFVWFLTDCQFFEASNGWVFAWEKIAGVLVLPLEPLAADLAPAAFDQAWSELVTELRPRVALFVSIYPRFLATLQSRGFQSCQIGIEPWVRLDSSFGKGNSAKGVRSARNQAVKAGVTVEGWDGRAAEADDRLRTELRSIQEQWRRARLLRLEGFLNRTDPLFQMHCRKYWVARLADGTAIGHLVVTPIPGAGTRFLEDLVLTDRAPRGTGELLTLEALDALQREGVGEVSLGVVSTGGIERAASHRLPRSVSFLLEVMPRAIRSIYNFEGLLTFRKRFKPSRWGQVHLALRNLPGSGMGDAQAWFRGLWAIVALFRPRWVLSWAWLGSRLSAPFRRYPVTLAVFALELGLFLRINRGGKLPQYYLDHYGFFGNAPPTQWLIRSVASDHLYFDRWHYLVCGLAMATILGWVERSHRLRFTLILYALVSVFDDLVNYFAVITPFRFLQPAIFDHLVRYKDVGSSLLVVTLLGLQLCQIRRHREILFAGLVVVMVFGFAFSSDQHVLLIVNLNHFLFFCLGYVIGKLRYQFQQTRNRRASRGAAPRSTVLPGASRGQTSG